MRSTCGDHSDGVFWTKFGQFGPSDDHFRGQKAIFRIILGLKTACLLMKWPFGSPKGVPKGPRIGQSYLRCKPWPVRPLCGVWNQIWCRIRLADGQKVPYRNQADPPEPPQTPLNPFSDPSCNQFNPSSYLITHCFSQNHPKLQKPPKNEK